MRAAAAALEPDCPDETARARVGRGVVDDRAADRPDLTDLAAARELRGEGPAVSLALGDEREHGQVVGGEAVVQRRAPAYRLSRD
jgi:hypothetical protein